MMRDFVGLSTQSEMKRFVLDSQLWHACAGGMVQMPPLNSKVFYFPQGHAEQARGDVDFRNLRIPPMILCRISSIKYMADQESDEVYAKIRLMPFIDGNFGFLGGADGDFDDGLFGGVNEFQEKPASFAKTLTQSDANNGGGFSVPRYCAETIFPKLDYNADPPVQTILAKDVHGEAWKFRHIYRGTPRRHLLTTGWSNFVNQKKLVAGDSIVFLRAENGDLCVGIRRAKSSIGGGSEFPPSGWNSFGFMEGNGSKLMRSDGSVVGDSKGKVSAESITEAACLAASGQPFEIVYYPRASTPEFFVRASAVKNAMQIQWIPGLKFKMPFETEDSSRISWFMGTISSVQVAHPIRWPNSLWRLLEVVWDEPDLLQNVKRVSPWLVELVSNVPPIHLSPFSPPRKKLRIPQLPDFPFMNEVPFPTPMPAFAGGNPIRSNSPMCFVSNNTTPAGIQGARQPRLGLSPLDLHFNNLHSGLFPLNLQQPEHIASVPRIPSSKDSMDHNTNKDGLKENTTTKTPHLVLFGQKILPEQSQSCSDVTNESSEKLANVSDSSGSALNATGPLENFADGYGSELGQERTRHCKVFLDSVDVGQTLDLSLLGSYEDLYRKLASMFGIKSLHSLSNVLYQDAEGADKHTGDEPFCEFSKTARRLKIVSDASSDNIGS